MSIQSANKVSLCRISLGCALGRLTTIFFFVYCVLVQKLFSDKFSYNATAANWNSVYKVYT